MYGIDACYLSKLQLNSLNFVINRLFSKLFKTNNTDMILLDIVNHALVSTFDMPSELWVKRVNKLNEKCSYSYCD